MKTASPALTTPAEPTATSAEAAGLLGFWRVASPNARRALVGAALGWMLAFGDVMIYSLVLAALMLDLGLSTTAGGLLGSLTLMSSVVGGVLCGVIADRYGRTRAITVSIWTYSVFTALCGFVWTAGQLAVLRILVGIGLGGQWASGASLVSETSPAEHRGKALAFMQSTSPLGRVVAAAATALIMPIWGWRAVFFIGLLPGALAIWVRRRVEEPEIWRRAQSAGSEQKPRKGLRDVFRGRMLPVTVAITSMNVCTMFAWWGFNLWNPAYLSLPVSQGGIGLSAYVMSGLIIVMAIVQWFGVVSFGFISDYFGRKRSYVAYLLIAAVAMVLYASVRDVWLLLILGSVVTFFGAGHYAGFGAVTAEIYPTEIRATAQGFTYNIGRTVAALAPFAVGTIAHTHGFGIALTISSIAFIMAAICWIWIPETKGKALE